MTTISCIFCRRVLVNEQDSIDHYYGEHALTRGMHDSMLDYEDGYPNGVADPLTAKTIQQALEKFIALGPNRPKDAS